MKFIFRFLKKSMKLFLAFLAIYCLAVLLLMVIPANSDFIESPDGVPVYLISNGVHMDICLPLKDSNENWDEILNLSVYEKDLANRNYLSFGWGDKDFYINCPTWEDLTVQKAVNAMFLPSPTAMHVTIYRNEPEAGELIRKIMINPEQLKDMEKFILNGIPLNNGSAQFLEFEGYAGMDDRFYKANGNYSMLYNCNSWTNCALISGGVKTARWTTIDKAMFYHFDL